MIRTTAFLLLTSLAVGCGAESALPEAPAAAQKSLFGNVSPGADCSPGLRTFLNKIMFYGRTAATSAAFTQCVDQAMRSGITLGGQSFGRYRQCNGDPYYGSTIDAQIARVLQAARSVNDININCTGGAGNASTYIGTYGHIDAESLSFGGWLTGVYNSLGWPICNGSNGPNCRAAADPWPYSQASGIVWHEAMHTHGYTHGANDQANGKIACGYPSEPDWAWHFQFNTLPYILGDCISAVIDQSGTTCGGLETCGPGQLRLITGVGSGSCQCVSDPNTCANTTSTITHFANASNISGNWTSIDHPLANNNPSAVVTVTPNWNPGGAGGTYLNRNIGVWYTGTRWAIFNQDGAAMPVGASFNVSVGDASVFRATASNVFGNVVELDDPRLNNNPSALLSVTQNWQPSGVYNNSPIGTWFKTATGKWTVYNQNNTVMPVNASFNVKVSCGSAHTAAASNISGNWTQLDLPAANGNPYARVQATPVLRPGGASVNHPIGVWYTGTRWAIFNQDGATMPAGASFVVTVQ